MALSTRLTDTGLGVRADIDALEVTDASHTSQLAQTASLAYLNEKTGYGVISGLGVTQQTVPDMTVRVAAGVIWMANGDRFAPVANNALVVTAAAATIRRDIVYVNSAGAIAYLAGTAATLGQRTYAITTNAVAGDTFIVNGITFTAVAAGATGAQFNVGANSDETATNLAAVINAHASFSLFYAVTAGTNIITILQKVAVDGAYTPSVATFTGTIQVTNTLVATAVAAADPTTPAGGQQISSIYVAAGDTAIGTAEIFDRRKNIYNEPWIEPTLLNGWSAMSTALKAYYYKDSNGTVRLTGKIGTGILSQTAFNLLSGYRPSQTLNFGVSSNNAFGNVYITPVGAVVVNIGATTNVSLDGISFRAG